LFSEVATTSGATCAAIGMWQHIFYFIDTGIFKYIQAFAGDSQKQRQQDAKSGHERKSKEDIVQCSHAAPRLQRLKPTAYFCSYLFFFNFCSNKVIKVTIIWAINNFNFHY
jgi:hypothetical protein